MFCCLGGPQFIYPFVYWRTYWLPPSFAIFNQAAVNIHVQIFVWTEFSTPLGRYQGGHFLECTVRVCLVLEETLQRSPTGPVPFGIPTAMNESCFCSPSSPACGFASVWLDFDHSNRGLVVFCFNLHFLTTSMWSIFYVLADHLCVFSDEVFVEVFGPVFNGLQFPYCWVLSILCIFWRVVIYQITFLVYLSQKNAIWLMPFPTYHFLP